MKTDRQSRRINTMVHAAQLYSGGLSVPKIATNLGRSTATINRWLRIAGVKG